ncbi:sodium:proline symporter [Amphritea sp. 2_MG-2023]|uniref:sodium:proline symporter n=1 Tax=Amphritea TaxID=515417 RepID=UPI001C06C2A0|nr:MULTISPECIES: sodium:proline symporter [Amphritea]MBU2964370.1 sodium:proline symporter [Amphritea atlantica]MDO6419670.1 sodium:proline symporter [Amphritea sp. 2_MG-2023]
MEITLIIAVATVAIFSVFISPKAHDSGAFFKGLSPEGKPPGLLLLTFSQVTTWIFARSLLNAAILGFYYGIWGTLAYAAYYLSFLTGAKIIDSVRFQHGFDSIQAFLTDRFGHWGTRCYNFVIGVRLVSEVFANILVIGILFGVAGGTAYTTAVALFAVVTLLYSMLGGLHASLRTDLFQMVLFLFLLAVLTILVLATGQLTSATLLFKSFAINDPGPILILVALLQIWSYPMHDPVMMDRGFIADRETTRKSFYHAAWISFICIMLFGSFGIIAGANALNGEAMNTALMRILGETPMLLFNITLVISAMSTLDSTLSSASKLVAVDMRWIEPSVVNGRITMAVFVLLGLLLVFSGNKDLFSAVAVSGTASMYLAPVIFFSLWGGRTDIPLWSYLSCFFLSLAGAALYFTESAGHTQLLGDSHKYTKLLGISMSVLITGCLLFWAGMLSQKHQPALRETAI